MASRPMLPSWLARVLLNPLQRFDFAAGGSQYGADNMVTSSFRDAEKTTPFHSVLARSRCHERAGHACAAMAPHRNEHGAAEDRQTWRRRLFRYQWIHHHDHRW